MNGAQINKSKTILTASFISSSVIAESRSRKLHFALGRILFGFDSITESVDHPPHGSIMRGDGQTIHHPTNRGRTLETAFSGERFIGWPTLTGKFKLNEIDGGFGGFEEHDLTPA